MRRLYLLLLLPAALAASAACLPPRKAAPAPAAQPARKAIPLSAEQKKKVEQLYYRAVGAYSNNDMAAASAFIREILAICPNHAEALELREKIRLASGRK